MTVIAGLHADDASFVDDAWRDDVSSNEFSEDCCGTAVNLVVIGGHGERSLSGIGGLSLPGRIREGGGARVRLVVAIERHERLVSAALGEHDYVAVCDFPERSTVPMPVQVVRRAEHADGVLEALVLEALEANEMETSGQKGCLTSVQNDRVDDALSL